MFPRLKNRGNETSERDIQVDSYPRAKIRNLEQMMIHPAETDGMHPEIVILSVGINDRANKPGVTTIPNLRRMAVQAGKCIPHSVIATRSASRGEQRMGQNKIAAAASKC